MISAELNIAPGGITTDARLSGNRLQADSLDLVCLIMAFATEFDLEIEDKEMKKIVTVGDVVNYIEQRQSLA